MDRSKIGTKIGIKDKLNSKPKMMGIKKTILTDTGSEKHENAESNSEVKKEHESEEKPVNIQHLLEAASQIAGNDIPQGKKNNSSEKQTAVVPPNNAASDTQHSNQQKSESSPAYYLSHLHDRLNEDGKKELDKIVGQYDPQLLQTILLQISKLTKYQKPKSENIHSNEQCSSSSFDQNNAFPKQQYSNPYIDSFMFPYNNPYMIQAMIQQMLLPSYGVNFPNQAYMQSSYDNQENNSATVTTLPSSTILSRNHSPTPASRLEDKTNDKTPVSESDRNLRSASATSQSLFSNFLKDSVSDKIDDNFAFSKEVTVAEEKINKHPKETVHETEEVDVVGVDEDSNVSTEFPSPKSVKSEKAKKEVEFKTGSLSSFLMKNGTPSNSLVSFADNVLDSNKDFTISDNGSILSLSAIFERQKSLKEAENNARNITAIINDRNPAPMEQSSTNNDEKEKNSDKHMRVTTNDVSHKRSRAVRKENDKSKWAPSEDDPIIIVSDDDGESTIERQLSDDANSCQSSDVEEGKTYRTLTTVSQQQLQLHTDRKKLIPVDIVKLRKHLMTLTQGEKQTLMTKLLLSCQKGSISGEEFNYFISCLDDKQSRSSEMLRNQSPKRHIAHSSHLSAKVRRCDHENSLASPSSSLGTSRSASSAEHVQPMTKQANEALRQLYLQDEDGDMLLHIAIAKEDVDLSIDIVKRMQGFRLNSMNKLGQTPLHMALYVHKPDIIRALLNHGADVKTIDGHGNSVIHIACEENSVELLECLFEFSNQYRKEYLEMSNYRNNLGMTALHIATQKENIDTIEYLVRKGVDLDVQEERSGATVLVQALQRKNLNLINLFIHSGADVSIPTYSGFYPLNYAVQWCKIDLVKVLLEKNANIGNKSTEYNDNSEDAKEIRKLLDKEMRKRRRKNHIESQRSESPVSKRRRR